MASKSQQKQRMIRLYKETRGITEVDMKEVAKFAAERGWPLPSPQDPLDRLAKEFTQAARDEIRYDQVTGKPYRANHAIPTTHEQLTFYRWIDIDEAPRAPIQKSLINRREQVVDDMVQLTLDAEHWNRIHPDEEPIEIPGDFTDDVEWRMNAPDEKQKVA